MFYLYILKSEKFGTYYIGVSSNVEKRLKTHNSGNVKSTQHKKPWSIVYIKSFSALGEARKEELRLKSLKKRKEINKLIEHF